MKTLLEVKRQTMSLHEFAIDKYPVTNGQFERFVNETKYKTEAEVKGKSETWRTHFEGRFKADYPVVRVSWHDAWEYARWAGKRLPTAEEWERADRGTTGRFYPWGNEWDPKKCNHANAMRGYETTPVDRFPKGCTDEGVCDLVGNVSEWTATEVKGGYYVVLGGAWNEACEIYGLIPFGRHAPPSLATDDLGFRCAR